jgi:hypothetical protein
MILFRQQPPCPVVRGVVRDPIAIAGKNVQMRILSARNKFHSIGKSCNEPFVYETIVNGVHGILVHLFSEDLN